MTGPELCTMCEQAPATTTWGFPVCQDCADDLTGLQGELREMEAADPELAAKGRQVEESFERYLAQQDVMIPIPQPGKPTMCLLEYCNGRCGLPHPVPPSPPPRFWLLNAVVASLVVVVVVVWLVVQFG